MQKKTIRAGLIGSGFAANFHFEALKRVHGCDVEVAGVWSPTAEKRDVSAPQLPASDPGRKGGFATPELQ